MRLRNFCLAVCALFLLAASQDYTVSVTTVTIWLKVVDKKGNPINGLKATDFQLFEGGERKEITCFEENRSKPQPSAPSLTSTQTQATQTAAVSEQISPTASKRFIVFLDLFNTSQPEYLYVRRNMFEFFQQIAQQQAEVEVAVLLPTQRLGIIVPFTKDYQRVQAKLEKLRGNPQRDQEMLYRKREITRLLENAGSIGEEVLSQAYALAGSYTKQEEHNCLFTLHALQSLGSFIAEKSSGASVVLLFVSGGVNYEPGRVYYDLVDRVVQNMGLDADPTAWATSMPNANREKNINIRDEIKKSVGRLNRKNILVYSINTRGMVQPDAANIYEQSGTFVTNDYSYLHDYQDSLDQIAEETGGLSFKNTQNFPHAFGELLNDLSNNYELCYNAPPHKKAGEYHKISIRSTIPGAQLRYRSGYID